MKTLRCVVACCGLAVAVPAVMVAQATRPLLTPAPCPATSLRGASADANADAANALRRSVTRLPWRGAPVMWTTWRVAVGSPQVPVDLIVARLDPRVVHLELAIRRDGEDMAPWRIDDTPDDAVIALNAGQFTDDGPWGWVVHRGREWQGPGAGALAAALVVDGQGRARIVPADSIASLRGQRDVVEAVQSYPHIVSGGQAVAALCNEALVHPTHRDIRLAVGTMGDGTLLVVLSRYAGLGGVAERVPLGPTTREMAQALVTLGARDGVLLDGGLSAQLRLRVADVTPGRLTTLGNTAPSGSPPKGSPPGGGRASGQASTAFPPRSFITHDWPGLRGVPLALIGRVTAELAPPDRGR